MKLANIQTENGIHLALMTERGLVDATAAGCVLSMLDLIRGADRGVLEQLAFDESLPVLEDVTYANVVSPVGKLLCVGLNYRSHVQAAGFTPIQFPTIFSKLDNALAPSNASICLPPWETTYDYEGELVVIIGKTAWGVSEEDAMDCIFGYTCGNDLSCRASQMRSGQWLIGKTMPGFGPCGPFVVTADSFDPAASNSIRTYVNGELRQDGITNQMIFNCAQVISYVSRYTRLEPGDLIFTGTPSGVVVEKSEEERVWLKAGDVVDVQIEGIGTLHSTLC